MSERRNRQHSKEISDPPNAPLGRAQGHAFAGKRVRCAEGRGASLISETARPVDSTTKGVSMGKHTFSSVLLVVALAVLGCESQETERDASDTDQEFVAVEIKPVPLVDPDTVRYRIVRDDTYPHQKKRSVHVEITAPVNESHLRRFAKRIKSMNRGYKLVFITYSVKGVVASDFAWATTHYRPDLEVNINGMSASQERSLIARIPEGDYIAKWLDRNAFLCGTI